MAVWYRTGTLSVTNGSTTVTGAGTGWTTTVRAGDFLFIGTNQPVEVATVVSNTSLTLAVAWGGSTGSGLSYAIAAGPQWGDVTRLSLQIAELIAGQVEILSGTGAPSGGLGSDGSVYFRQDVPEYYAKASGSWGSPISLVGQTGPAGPSYAATSTTSLAIGAASGTRTLTTQTGMPYTAGLRLRCTAIAGTYFEGQVLSYSGTILVITVDRVSGSGTFASWNINVTGEVGSANSLSIGTVTTGAAGSSASATITGSAPAQTLNLTIPRGNTGAAGPTGPDGPPGPSGTISVGTVTTGAAGSSASVVNAGTSTAAVFNFTIPRGDVGQAGANGNSFAHKGSYNAGTTYSYGDTVLDQNSSWTYINNTPGSGHAPPTLPTESNSYWQLAARAGVDGTGAGTVTSINGQNPVSGGAVTVASEAISVTPASFTPTKYTPSGSSITDHIAGLHAIAGGGNYALTTISSAATVDIGSAATEAVYVTGTTTITSLGTVANKLRLMKFAASLTLTHNATTLNLPGGLNLVTQADDIALFVSDGSGNWRCVLHSSGGGYATARPASAVITYTANATWTKPTGCKTINYYVIGGGGGGGGVTGAASSSAAGGGGGGGGYASGSFDVTSIGSLAIVVGTGGAGGANTGAAGNNGTLSSIYNGGSPVAIANGGTGGGGMLAGSSITVSSGGAGGAATNASGLLVTGNPGVHVMRLSGGIALPGNGGAGFFGGAGRGPWSYGAGGDGSGPGSGGGGAYSGTSAAVGGAGANGLVVIEEVPY